MININEMIFRIKPYSGTETIKTINKPWGKEIIWANSQGQYTAKILVVNKKEALSLQYHKRKNETMLVLDGTLRLTYGAHSLSSIKETIVSSGTVIHIPAETIHRIEAITTTYIMEVSSFDEYGDIVRLKDNYNRKG